MTVSRSYDVQLSDSEQQSTPKRKLPYVPQKHPGCSCQRSSCQQQTAALDRSGSCLPALGLQLLVNNYVFSANGILVCSASPTSTY